MNDAELLRAERDWLADLIETPGAALVTDRGLDLSDARPIAELVYETGDGARFELHIGRVYD